MAAKKLLQQFFLFSMILSVHLPIKLKIRPQLKKVSSSFIRSFLKVLENIGVKKIDTDGKDFNVDYHEAIAMVPGMGDDKKGKIIDCVQTGYTLNDKVIRHAKVAVGQ